MSIRQERKTHRFELSGLLDHFLAGYSNGSPKTQKWYADQVGRAFLGYCQDNGIATLDDVTPASIVSFLDAERLGTYERGGRVRRHSPATVRHRYTALNVFLNWCVEREYIDVNPCHKVRAPKVPDPQIDGAFTREEIGRLLRQSNYGVQDWLAARDRAIIMTLLDTGCRAGGLLGMTDRSIVWSRDKQLVLHEKGGKTRYVPLAKPAQDAIKDYLHLRPECECSTHDGGFWLTRRHTRLKHGSLSMMLENLGKYAGVEHVHPHRFRHTFAVLFYENSGHNIIALMERLGHTKIEITMRYLRTLGVYVKADSYGGASAWLA